MSPPREPFFFQILRRRPENGIYHQAFCPEGDQVIRQNEGTVSDERSVWCSCTGGLNRKMPICALSAKRRTTPYLVARTAKKTSARHAAEIMRSGWKGFTLASARKIFRAGSRGPGQMPGQRRRLRRRRGTRADDGLPGNARQRSRARRFLRQ